MCHDAQRRLAVLDVSENAYGRREDEPAGRGRGLHLRDEVARGVDVHFLSEAGSSFCSGGMMAARWITASTPRVRIGATPDS